jgi:hypothetical protein
VSTAHPATPDEPPLLDCIKNDVLFNMEQKKVLLRAKKVGHQISVSFEKFDVVQALLSCFFDTIPADSLKIYLFYTLIFLFQMPSSFDKGRF